MTYHIHLPSDPRVFVFGSNLMGIHAGGAALYAARELGAEDGVGTGFTGRCYALPTCIRPGEPLPLARLREYADGFIAEALRHPELRFFVSAVGCGIASHREEDVAPMFARAPDNCDLPPGWRR